VQQVYVRIEQTEPALDPDLLSVSIAPDGSTASATLSPSCALAPGVHSGVLTIALCRDAACTSRFPVSGNTIPYTFTVSPGALVTAKVNGVAQPGFAASCGGTLHLRGTVGQTVEFTSTVPVSWSSSMGGGTSFPTMLGLASSPTTWTCTLGIDSPYGPPAANTVFGNLSFMVTPTAGPSNPIALSVDVATP
jgi:hypothetical protein